MNWRVTDQMQCKICGEPVTQTDDEGGTQPGDEFTEYYECPHGHVATISGTVGEPVKDWRYVGLKN